jgi:transposase
MKKYHNYVGIDIGKFNFVVSVHNCKGTKTFENNPKGIASFIKDYKTILDKSLCVLETTGGYEMKVLMALCERNVSVHRANTRKVKNFIHSFGNSVKTDALDAKALALYGFERQEKLELFKPKGVVDLKLYQLTMRRQDLIKMLISEKTRLQAPDSEFTKKSCGVMIKAISEQIKYIDEEIDSLIMENTALKSKKEILKTIPGIGESTAMQLLVLLPELGLLNRKQIASLTGLAPRANDSGTYKGYRSVARGRENIKPILFMSAMAARRSKTYLKDFYNTLISNGKKKMVALTALMRKIIVISNAKIRDLLKQSNAIKI